MGRRVLAFFLGMLVGIVFVFGSIALALYIAVTVIHPKDIFADSERFIGDLADMSLYDSAKSIIELYRDKVGFPDDDGMYFTLGQFCEHYNVDPTELFGKEVPDDVLEIPVFEFFAADGKDPAMEQVMVSAFFSLVNMFTTDANGDFGLFTNSALEKLHKHHMNELTDENKGFSYVFDEVQFVDILPNTFPAEKSENNAGMWAFGKSSFGKLLGGVDGNVLLHFKEGGAFETVGSLKMTELFGKGSSILNAVFKDNKISALVNDDGSINIDGLMDEVFFGELMEYARTQFDEEYVEGFTQICSNNSRAVLQRGSGDEAEFVLKIATSNEGDFALYDAQLACNEKEATHVHDADCYGFVWYRCGLDTPSHKHVERCLAVGMMGKLADEKIMELQDLDETIKSYTLADVMGKSLPDIFSSIKDVQLKNLGTAISTIYLGDFLGYERGEMNGQAVWFSCGRGAISTHNHTNSCVATGMMGKLSDLKLSELGNLGDIIMTFTLKDVMGDKVPGALKAIENTPLSQLGTALDNMYLGGLLQYVRVTPSNLDDYAAFGKLNTVKQLVGGENDVLYAKLDAKDNSWYNAVLDCSTKSHANGNHVDSCFEFVWYTACKSSHEHTDSCYRGKEITGAMGKLASLTIAELSVENLTGVIKDTKLGEVINVNGNLLLGELADVKIGDLSEELSELYVGTAMGYFRRETDEELTRVEGFDNLYALYGEDGSATYYKYEAKKDAYFHAQLSCAKKTNNHTHNDDCYNFVWYKCTRQSKHSKHDANCMEQINGLNGKMANLSIDDLANDVMDELLGELTIGDLIDSGMITFDKKDEEENFYKFAVMCCDDDEHDCTMSQYFVYRAMQKNPANVTAKEFWMHAHGANDESEIDVEHRDAWRSLSLDEFISNVFGAF